MANGPKSSWSNPWVWAGLGCCGGCVLVPLLVIALLGGGAFWAVTSSGARDLRTQAIERARQDPAVQEALGEPIEAGWLGMSNLRIDNGRTVAQLEIPLSGPKGEASLDVEAERGEGEDWRFEIFEVRLGDGRVIDLREAVPLERPETTGPT